MPMQNEPKYRAGDRVVTRSDVASFLRLRAGTVEYNASGINEAMYHSVRLDGETRTWLFTPAELMPERDAEVPVNLGDVSKYGDATEWQIEEPDAAEYAVAFAEYAELMQSVYDAEHDPFDDVKLSDYYPI